MKEPFTGTPELIGQRCEESLWVVMPAVIAYLSISLVVGGGLLGIVQIFRALYVSEYEDSD